MEISRLKTVWGRRQTLLNYIFILSIFSLLTPCGERRRETEPWCFRLHQLREHDRRDQRCHQEQETCTCAAGAVAVVTLTALKFSSNGSWNLCIAHCWAQQLGGTALHGHLFAFYSHWENENNISVLGFNTAPRITEHPLWAEEIHGCLML